ncbi:U-box domain-containing protein 3 [Cocos nucifera]|uniref:RING-type E3 ubiquitin transferase n=1 Tax=Cocos nucifera TaxID=13894 RepID=A0A8K0IJ13_COCNU|nr:U-box domain-containing protein 3 [Cocos nucifera]
MMHTNAAAGGIHTNRGAMDGKVIGGLINSISRFIHLVGCQTTNATVLKDFKSMVGILKLLKPILHEAFDSQIPSNEQLIKAFEELDVAVNGAREFMEKRPQRMSRIYSVLQSEPMLLKVQKSSIEICHVLSELLPSSQCTSHLADIQHCLQQLQCIQQDLTSELIKNALKDQRGYVIPSQEDIIKIMDMLGLASNQELLMESIALEKEREKAELKEKTEDADHISQIIALVAHMRYCVAKHEQFGFINGLPIPSHFHCPLSLQLMLDPVIVASGQTYERSFIQTWLDSGLRICPRTHQILSHINLIPNFTVKELIANWCEDNNIRLNNSVQSDFISNPFLSNAMLEDFRPENNLYGSLHTDSTSTPSFECANQTEQQIAELSSGCGEESSLIGHHQKLAGKVTMLGNVSHEQPSSCHNHSESISSVVSSIEILSKFNENISLLGEVPHPSSSPLNKDMGFSPRFSPSQLYGLRNGHVNNIASQLSLPIPGSADLTTSSHVQKLIEDLKCQAPEVQTAAASELRLLSKHNMENRVLIAKYGAIPPLVYLLHSKVKKVQENAVTALLNLSLNDNNKVSIAEAGAMEPLIYVLECGSTEAKENSAAALFSLSVLEEYKVKIGRSGAIKALVNLLGSGSLRGKKDAATALFNLSIFHENKARIVQAGAVKYLVELMDPSTGMVDKSVALLANLSTVPEGRLAISQEGGIPLLVEIVETGSQRGKENAASALLQLCLHSHKFCSLVLQEGAVPPLIALSQFGTPRAKEKAQQILGHFRNMGVLNLMASKNRKHYFGNGQMNCWSNSSSEKGGGRPADVSEIGNGDLDVRLRG